MKVLDYFQTCCCTSVLDELFGYYEGSAKSKDGYVKVWEKVKTLTPTNSKFVCLIDYDQDWFDETVWYFAVRGKMPGDENSYAIEYERWENWLDMEVELSQAVKDLNQSNEQILSHILWEMTWGGYDQDKIQDQFGEIADDLKKLKGELGIENDMD